MSQKKLQDVRRDFSALNLRKYVPKVTQPSHKPLGNRDDLQNTDTLSHTHRTSKFDKYEFTKLEEQQILREIEAASQMRKRSNSVVEISDHDRQGISRRSRHRRGSVGSMPSDLAAQLREIQGFKTQEVQKRVDKKFRHSSRLDSTLDLEQEFALLTLQHSPAPVDTKRQGLMEYKDGICNFRRRAERDFVVSINYMEMQEDINSKMREILIDWLVEVHLKFKLQPETLHLTVQIIDRFLARRMISRSKLQLVGCASLLIASKYEEINPPEIKEFVYVCDRAYTAEQLLDMEGYILNVLSFRCTTPSALHFADQFLSAYSRQRREPAVLKSYVFFFLELSLQDFTFVPCLPSLRAATALYLGIALITKKKDPRDVWDSSIAKQTQYSLLSISRCAVALYSTITARPGKFRAIRKKYAHPKFHHVSLADTSLLAFHVSALLQEQRQ